MRKAADYMTDHDHLTRRTDEDLAPDPVVEAFKKDVDRTLIREQLRRTVDTRVRNMIAALRFAERLREGGAALVRDATDS
jgi:hypothetical protein